MSNAVVPTTQGKCPTCKKQVDLKSAPRDECYYSDDELKELGLSKQDEPLQRSGCPLVKLEVAKPSKIKPRGRR